MPASKEELIERAQIVRLYEANTGIQVPSELDLRFRRSLMIKLANEYALPKTGHANLLLPVRGQTEPAAPDKSRRAGKPF